MVVKSKYRKAKCSLCAKTFRRSTSGELIKAVHAHWLKAHTDALKRRIKKGMKKAKGGSQGNNPAWLNAVMGGVFPPANIPVIKTQYGQLSPSQRDAVKKMIAGLTLPLGGEASAVAAAVMRGLDFMVGDR